jgi:excisionase family DNA binding protein
MEILLTVREVCSTLKISERTLARYVKKAKIEAIKLGQLRRFRSSDIQTIIKKGI